LVATDIDGAKQLAAHGRHFTKIEKFLVSYYQFMECLEKKKKGQKTPYDEYFEESEKFWPPELVKRNFVGDYMEINTEDYEAVIKMDAEELCGIFIRAVNEQDPKKIYEIAKAVEFAKTVNETADPLRARLLQLKGFLDANNEKWPIRKVAMAIHWPHENNQDGFSRLRRLCNELKFPLVPARQIRG
jgi:hypothetical protein